jgi:hypothetical protein
MRTVGLALGMVVAAAFAALPSRGSVVLSDCAVTDVRYTIFGNLRVTETPLGAGDGEYHIGPGSIVLRFQREVPSSGGPVSSVRMLSYEMRERFAVLSKALFWKTKVTTDTQTTAKPGGGWLAEGTLTGRSIRWSRFAGTFRTDGTETCEGAFCGSFGAPPTGTSPFHQPPAPFEFRSFDFSADMKTFVMPSTFDSKSDAPRQVSYVALAGRESERLCVAGDAP